MNHRRSQIFRSCLRLSQPAAQSHAQTGSSPPLGDGRQKCRRHVDRNRIRDSHEFSLTEDTRSSASVTAPFGESTKRDCTDSHRFEKRSCSIGSRSRMLSFSIRFSRSANFASAFRSDPCSRTARSYSGPNFCRRSCGRTPAFSHIQPSKHCDDQNHHAAASTINFGSIRFRFIETSMHQECPQDQNCSRSSLWRQNLVNRQYQTSGFGKLVRIDRVVNQCCGI